MPEKPQNPVSQEAAGPIELAPAPVPVLEKFAYGMRAFAQQLGNNGMKMFAFPAYGMILGLDAGLIGMVFVLMRVYDAVTDSLMGWISDNTRTRWGRRRPFIFVGAIGGGLAFALLWLPSTEWSDAAKFAYFAATSILFYTFFTIMVVPGDALGWELSPDYAERTRVMSWFSSTVKVALMIMPWMFALTQAPFWASEQQGLQVVGAAFGLLFILTGILPAIFCKERNYKLASREGKQKFWHTAKLTFTNKTIVLVYAFVVTALLGGTAFGLFGTHLAVYYLFDGSRTQGSVFFGIISVIGGLAGLATIAVINRLFIQCDKRKVVLVSLACAVFGWLTGLLFITPANPWFFVIPITLNSVGVSGVFLLLGSILADVADDDELRHGYRREGAIGAFSSFCGKLANTIPAAIGGALLTWVGFDAALPQQSLETLSWMRGIVIGFPIFGFSAAFVLMWFYPLSKQRMLATRAALEARRGSVVND